MKKLHFYIAVLLLFGCGQDQKLFKNASSEETGVVFQNTLTETDDFNILDYLYFYNGGGTAVGDINNDGLPDIYLSGNQVKNKLYLNKGNLQFEDITETAGVSGESDWNTGAIMGDINGDGWLDIYVCAVVGLRGLGGHNELFLNNGDNTFTESSRQFGLDYDTYSSTAALLDYDLDGDLDMYLLNHAVHTQESFGHAKLRYERNYETGDKLLRNDGGRFTDVSEEAGIFGGINGYGLGIAVSDFNQDGFPDLYIGNDFHEDDYYYVNNGDGTFSDQLRQRFGHTTRFSMGNDVSDINNDGLPDLISLDMLPEDERVLKSSEGDDTPNIMRLRTERYGYHYQFSRNMLQIMQNDGSFSESALLSGVAATDWSWSALFADYNNDGKQDLFISNGIPRRPNDLDYIRFVSDEQIRNKIDATKLVDQEALELMPSGAIRNYLFTGNNDLQFVDRSEEWVPDDANFSTATALSDLDNDGDLDLIINNINAEANIYANQTRDAAYLRLKFNFRGPNTFGIGTKVYSYLNGQLQFKELYTVRGFQSSSEPVIHFGYGQASKVDSIRIIWPDKSSQLLTDIQLNQTLIVSPETTSKTFPTQENESSNQFTLIEGNLGIIFIHTEDRYTDFDRQKLIPYQISDRGPATAIGDLNDDGLDDIFFGGSKFKPSHIYTQSDSGFTKSYFSQIRTDSITEDISAIIGDFNQDSKNDLLVATGGGDFYNKMKPLLDNLYTQSENGFNKNSLPEMFENASIVAPADFDNDGDLDVFVGNHAITNDFGKIPNSYLLQNNQTSFEIVQNESLQHAGMLTDAIWTDFDADSREDLILIGEWMPPRFFKNNAGELIEVKLLKHQINGLWQSIAPFDIDSDGDLDYILGNWGKNSKFIATDEYPLRMYYNDFDKNGSTETVLATAKSGKYYPLLGLNELASQMVELRKKYTAYKDFAGQTIEQIFEDKLDNAILYEVNTLESGYLINENGEFSFTPFPAKMQLAPIMTMSVFDFDKDGQGEVLAAGNYFGLTPFHGRLGSFPGALINSANDIQYGDALGLKLINKSARHINIIRLQGDDYLLVTLNNDAAQVYSIN
ncbi:MAG: VCBS repeat-containing protein [Cyclobacteriaceae bacterium]